MDKTNGCFAANYAEARAGFLAGAKHRGLEVVTDLNPLKGAQGEGTVVSQRTTPRRGPGSWPAQSTAASRWPPT